MFALPGYDAFLGFLLIAAAVPAFGADHQQIGGAEKPCR